MFYSATESHYFRFESIHKQHTLLASLDVCEYFAHIQTFRGKLEKKLVMFISVLNVCECRCEIWKSGSVINRWHGETPGFVRPGSSARLLHSLGGRLVCIVSPLSHPRSEGLCFDKCCPYCPVKYTCRSTDIFKTTNSALHLCIVQTRIKGGYRKCIYEGEWMCSYPLSYRIQ